MEEERYSLKEIKNQLRIELKEAFPNKWKDRYYTVVGYLIGTFERLKNKSDREE